MINDVLILARVLAYVIPPMKSQTILLYNPYVNGNRANKPTMKHRRSLKLLSCGRWWFLQQILRERHTLNDILISSLSTLQSPPQNWYEKIKLYWPSPWYKMKQTPFEKNKIIKLDNNQVEQPAQKRFTWYSFSPFSSSSKNQSLSCHILLFGFS